MTSHYYRAATGLAAVQSPSARASIRANAISVKLLTTLNKLSIIFFRYQGGCVRAPFTT